MIWTRELLLEKAGLKPVRDVKQMLNRTRRAMSATKPDGTEDHLVRLQGVDRMAKFVGIDKSPEPKVNDELRPIAVNLILAGPQVHTNGFGVHLQLSDGQQQQ